MLEKTLAQMIDHTLLKPDASEQQLKVLCDQCKEYHFKMAAINSGVTKKVAEFLKGSEVHVGAAISFPFGTNTIEAKVFETKDAIENGANEIDYVLNLRKLKAHDLAYIEDEMRRIKEVTDEKKIILKVIFENCYLEKEDIVNACKVALKVKPDFIKTSTGYGTYGARKEDVKLMKEIVGDQIQIKAAGGIRTLKDALDFIDLGATRIGTSHGVEIIKELREHEISTK